VNNRELEQHKRSIWAKHEKSMGHRIKPAIRQYIENTLFHGIYDTAALEDLDVSIPDYLGLIAILPENSGSRFLSETKSRDRTRKKRYWKCFERRLHIVDFVMGNDLTLNNLVNRSFAPRKRIMWKLICDKWNKAHPYDLIKLEVLKVQFYRAIAEEDIQREYFVRKEKEIADMMAPIMAPLAESMNRLSNAFREMTKGLIR